MALLELLVAVSNVGAPMAICLSMQEQGQLNRGVRGVGGAERLKPGKEAKNAFVYAHS